MFRWSFLAPRMLVVLAACLWVRFGLDPLLKHAAELGGSTLVGAKVEVGDLQTSLAKGRLHVSNVQVADPHSPMRNLIQFNRAWLDLDNRAALDRRLVVSRGIITGLAFDAPRKTSGALEPAAKGGHGPESDGDCARQVREQFGRMADDWLDGLASRLRQDATDEFRCVALAAELSARWPAECKQLADRVEGWKERIDRIRDLVDRVRSAPARSDSMQYLDAAQKGLAELQSMQGEISSLRAELERLRNQMRADRDRIQEVGRADLQKIRELLKLQDLKAEELSDYLLGEDVARQIGVLCRWFERGREVLDFVNSRPDLNSERGRGRVIPFGPGSRDPSFLIRSVALAGNIRWNDEVLPFAGRAQNLTYQPRRLGQPARFQVTLEGDSPVRLDGTVDYRGPTPRHHFVVLCPRVRQPARTLGDADRLAVAVSPGSAQLWILADMDGSRIQGQIRWRQDGVVLQPVVAKGLGGARLQERLAKILSNVDRLHAAVEISGTLTQPRVQLQTNLGPQLVSGINTVAQDELTSLADRLVDRGEKQIVKRFDEWERAMQTERERLLGKLREHEQQIEQFKQQLAGHVKLPPEWLQQAGRLGRLLGG